MRSRRESKAERRSILLPLIVCALVYLAAAAVAIGVGIVVSRATTGDSFVSASVAAAASGDIAATLFVFLFSVIFNNSSIYDPYWSAAPPAIAAYFLVTGLEAGRPLLVPEVLALTLLLLWSGRLTFNWARGWRGFAHEDWRYSDFRRTAGRAYWFVSFLGFHLFPTILVFLGCLSLLPLLTASSHALSPLSIVALLVIAAAVWIEARADRELYTFKKNRESSGTILTSGLWSYSRHPNYFGEVLFWWGLYLAGLAANPSYWWTVVGPLAITALFFFVSVPMMERHMAGRHPEYEEARYGRSPIVPWFRR